MEHGATSSPPEPATAGMARHAVSGTGWSAFQGIVNKLATMVSMLVVGRFLAPGEYGAAALVLGIGSFIVLLPPAVMGDVLLSVGARSRGARRTARRIVLASAVVSSAAILLSIPVFVGLYPKFPGGTLTALLAVFAVRPLADAAGVAPLARLRGDLRFVTIAAVDGGIQFAATLLTIALAAWGAGALALVMPQAAGSVAKAVLYLWFTRGSVDEDAQDGGAGPGGRTWRAALIRQFTVAALAQHAHTLVGNLPMLILGMLSSETETGIYSFAFFLSVQATFVISYQVAIVLQPIFVRLGSDPARQASGFIRVVATVGSVAVPLSLLQAVLAEPLLRLLFGERWLGAIPTFAALSVGQAFFFAVAPVMSMLRAQGRFRTILVWQLAQLAPSAGAYVVAARHGALAVAAVDTAAWAVAVPLVAWRCVAGRGPCFGDIARSVFAPWLTALPIAAAAYGCWVLLAPFGLPGVVVAVAVIGPVAGIASLFAVRLSQPLVHAELAPAVASAVRKARSLRERLVVRFVSRGS